LTAVLADSSVWVAHFRKSNDVLQSLLAEDRVLCPLPLIEKEQLQDLGCGKNLDALATRLDVGFRNILG
jgi:hypothetical protein